MIKKVVMLLVLFGTAGMTMQVSSEHVVSLRGHTSLDENSGTPVQKKYAKDGEPIERDYVQQPPLIPHKIRGYKVNLKSNKCLSCHSWKTYREKGATKISQTHFEDRDLNVLANISARRYFCTQCHVPQVDAKPLIENTFQAITAISSQ